MHSIFGLTHPDSGEINLYGKKALFKKPQEAIASGMAYITEDRKKEGLVLPMGVHHNMTLSSLKGFTKTGLLLQLKEAAAVDEQVKALGVKVSSPRQSVKSLSGGNQQKVVLAKWMITAPKIIIFDEPTRGIDVGAKAEIYKIMGDYVSKGYSIIMVSSEMPEAMGMSDRIIVLSNHKMSGEISREEFSQESIVQMQFRHM
jgi:ABC-type sugar transport system ATPase subunit